MCSVTDPSVIRSILNTDRSWAVYALGDLSPELFPHCEWYCTAGDAPAVVLLYRAFGTPVLFTLGETSAVEALLEAADPPGELYLHVRPEIIPVLRKRYEVPHPKTMWRMILDPQAFRGASAESVARLGSDHLAALERLYADGEPLGEAPDFFTPAMLAGGVYFGVWEDDDLVAAGGTHLVVPTEDIAAIGNVYTRRDRRGRGLATLVTAAVTAELMRLGLGTIALNVEQRNAAAIRVYQRLGFVRYCPFHEGAAIARSE